MKEELKPTNVILGKKNVKIVLTRTNAIDPRGQRNNLRKNLAGQTKQNMAYM